MSGTRVLLFRRVSGLFVCFSGVHLSNVLFTFKNIRWYIQYDMHFITKEVMYILVFRTSAKMDPVAILHYNLIIHCLQRKRDQNFGFSFDVSFV